MKSKSVCYRCNFCRRRRPQQRREQKSMGMTVVTFVAMVLCTLPLCWITVDSFTAIQTITRPPIASRKSISIPIVLHEGPSSLNDNHYSIKSVRQIDDDPNEFPISSTDASTMTRRQALWTSLVTGTALLSSSTAAIASVAEIDKATGSLYTPKKVMLAGGSAAARGVELQAKSEGGIRIKPGQQLQNVYETRFIAYLSRFLLNFDDAAAAWWEKNTASILSDDSLSQTDKRDKLQFIFAEFSESVEIGLADYFVGPYGSYSSLSAMKAGITAKSQAKSKRYDDGTGNYNNSPSNLSDIIFSKKDEFLSMMDKEKIQRKTADRDNIAKNGVLNLYTLLKARYTSRTAKRQLAILFSFFSNPNIQPTAEIKSLLGEVDNANVTKIDLIKPVPESEFMSRTSSRRGGGYSISEPPMVNIEPPPALGSAYLCAKAKPIMKPTSRVLRINVLDGGEGYVDPPEVFVSGSGSSRMCSACAILDREGHIESVLVLDPGYGYGKQKALPPTVVIAPPAGKGTSRRKSSSRENGKNGPRQAIAKAELEYEIVGIEIVDGGNGYVATDPPLVTISPPEEDPDWFVDVPELAIMESEFGPLRAEVVEMLGPKGNLAYSLGADTLKERTAITPTQPVKIPLQRVRDDPTELLPSAIRPELNSYGVYVIPPIAAIRTFDNIVDNPRFRAVDPLFGAIGTLPAQKSANELKLGEYARLALSGAVCTVLVRTALNPLELIKTKLQLENDEELLSFARTSMAKTPPSEPLPSPAAMNIEGVNMTGLMGGEGDLTAIAIKPSISTKDLLDTEIKEPPVKIGSKDLILSLVQLRGPAALFQSADITFLASLVFGSLGFGATELFRRSFTMVFFSGEDSGQFNTEIVLLLAATVATIITSAAAAPFELLRVRSMGLVEPKKWTEVLKDFLLEKSPSDLTKYNETSDFNLRDLEPKDYKPLWQGFGPTASRELAFAIPKFLAFDIIARSITALINSQLGPGALPVQVGVGGAGLAISAFSGAVAGLAGALVSHPADLVLTRLSAAKKSTASNANVVNGAETPISADEDVDWRDVVKELLSKDGGLANLFVGLAPRMVFFFLVIGLQFFLYDYVKNLLQVGSDDLSLVLDVFYAVRQGLLDNSNSLM